MVYQIVSDYKFWELNPAFSDLKDDGEAIHAAVVGLVLEKSKSKRNCGGCGSISSIVRPFMSAFGRRAYELDVAGQEALVAYLTARRGYRPQPIIVYYNQTEGQTQELRL